MGGMIDIEEKYIVVEGIRTRFVQAGSGEPLILVHGIGGPLMWKRVVKPLSQYFQVVVVDLPGFGESGCPHEEYSTEKYTEFLDHFLTAINLRKASFAGVSYGGQIVAGFSCEYPDRVLKLILICSTGLLESKKFFENDISWIAISSFMKNTVLRSERLMCIFGRRSFYHIENRPAELCSMFYRQLSQNGKREAWLNSLRNTFDGCTKLREKLSSLNVPTLIIWGEHDQTVPVQFAHQFEQLIPDSMVKIFPECAHSVPLERPQEFCDAIVKFIQNSN